eukprot:m.58496 g.58496  ORF g.58496 m.58496 type:complete len:142 (+) comp9413_c0_seq2:2780-3205(+)
MTHGRTRKQETLVMWLNRISMLYPSPRHRAIWPSFPIASQTVRFTQYHQVDQPVEDRSTQQAFPTHGFVSLANVGVKTGCNTSMPFSTLLSSIHANDENRFVRVTNLHVTVKRYVFDFDLNSTTVFQITSKLITISETFEL